MAKKSKQPNDIVSAKQHPAITKTFLDILDLVSAAVNQDDDDPDQLVYEIELSEAKQFFKMEHEKNVIPKIRAEGVKDILHCPYNFFSADDGEKHIESVYVSGFRWDNTEVMSKLEIVLAYDYKQMLNANKGMIYYNPSDTIAMKSKYSRHIYLLLLKHKNRKPITFKAQGTLKGKQFTYYEQLDKFKDNLGIPESYQLSNVKRTVQTIVKDIEDNTDYQVEVFYNIARIPEKRKPTTTHIAWIIKDKPADIVEPEDYTVTDPGQNPDQFNFQEVSLAAQIMQITNLDYTSALSIAHSATLHAVPDDKVIECCEYAMKQTVDNLGGYINAMVSRGGKAEPQPNKPDPEQKPKRKSKSGKSSFNDFPQREYSDDEMSKIIKKMMNN